MSMSRPIPRCIAVDDSVSGELAPRSKYLSTASVLKPKFKSDDPTEQFAVHSIELAARMRLMRFHKFANVDTVSSVMSLLGRTSRRYRGSKNNALFSIIESARE